MWDFERSALDEIEGMGNEVVESRQQAVSVQQILPRP
jgi:hypothetical protein